MVRARISKNGIFLAEEGFDVDSAPLDRMILSPQFTTMRIVMMGYTTPVSFTGFVSDYHNRSIVSFPEPFSRPPIVFVSGVVDTDTSDQTPFVYTIQTDQGAFRILTHYSVETYTDRFELYTAKTGGTSLDHIPATWKYFVFANTLDP